MLKRKKIILILLVWVCLFATQTHAQAQLTLLNYNTRYGFQGDRALMDKFVEWVNVIDPDIVAFQEMTHFTQSDLEILAKRYGHHYAVISKEYAHPVAITSRYPIVNIQKVTVNLWHGYIYGNIKGIHFFVTHLSPFDWESRKRDIDMVLAHAKLLPVDAGKVIMGDLNALSPSDSAQYGELEVAMAKSEGRLEAVSGLSIVEGKTIHRNNLDDTKIDYSVVGEVLTNGFTDVIAHKHPDFQNSVPTESVRKKSSFLRRIDYIFVNDVLTPRIFKAEILKDELTHRMSDHYPVLLKLSAD
ncbi:endonuclease/exonuclease/phosphatase family protein [Sphingobacterium olei]|nr:endonuclease/exonuclease/phosphatase family protein [Sphingobacterium olei]